MMMWWWWWWWWWWIVFVAWLTDERRLALFQPEPLSEILTIANLRHAANKTWTCAEPEFRLCRAVVITTTPRRHFISADVFLLISIRVELWFLIGWCKFLSVFNCLEVPTSSHLIKWTHFNCFHKKYNNKETASNYIFFYLYLRQQLTTSESPDP